MAAAEADELAILAPVQTGDERLALEVQPHPRRRPAALVEPHRRGAQNVYRPKDAVRGDEPVLVTYVPPSRVEMGPFEQARASGHALGSCMEFRKSLYANDLGSDNLSSCRRGRESRITAATSTLNRIVVVLESP